MLPGEIKLPLSGMFKRCLKVPVLQSGDAAGYADELMNTLDREKSIDIDTAPEKKETALTTNNLY